MGVLCTSREEPRGWFLLTIDTPQAAAEERSKLSRALRESIESMKEAGFERATLEHAYKDRYNTALLKSERTSDAQRKAEAEQAASKWSNKLLTAEVIENYWKQRVYAIRSDMSLLMTVAAGIRHEFEEAHRGPN